MISTETERAGCPREVNTAFKLSLAAIAVDVIAWLLGTFVIPSSGLEEMRHEMGGDGALGQLARSAGALVATSALWLLLAFKMRAGRNWARIVLTVSAGVNVFFLLNSASMNGFAWSEDGIVYDLLVNIPILLAVGALVFLYRPASNAYFSETAHDGR